MKMGFQRIRFRQDALDIIEKADIIMKEYVEQGFDLTLRQLYYQFVARGFIENTERSYKRLESIVNDGRLAGLLDWDVMVDRTREVHSIPHWRDPAHIIRDDSQVFRLDLRSDQENYMEVWVEKEALGGIVKAAADKVDVKALCCRGFNSQSAMWEALKRFAPRIKEGKNIYIIYLGDHDPSGICMPRDIDGRMNDVFRSVTKASVSVQRLALNMDQIEQLQPPPNPAKVTDSRFQSYQAKFGDESWELDAIDPKTLDELITDRVLTLTDMRKYKARIRLQAKYRNQLASIASMLEDNPKLGL